MEHQQRTPQEHPDEEKKRSVFDYQIAGFPWSLLFLVTVMVIAVFVVVFKAMGVI